MVVLLDPDSLLPVYYPALKRWLFLTDRHFPKDWQLLCRGSIPSFCARSPPSYQTPDPPLIMASSASITYKRAPRDFHHPTLVLNNISTLVLSKSFLKIRDKSGVIRSLCWWMRMATPTLVSVINPGCRPFST